jgi:hypothetical protein
VGAKQNNRRLILGVTGGFAVQEIESVGLAVIIPVSVEIPFRRMLRKKSASGCTTIDSLRDTTRSRKSLEINIPILAWFQTEVRDLESPSS